MTSTQSFLHTIGKKIHKDNEKRVLFKKRFLIGFCKHHISRTSHHAKTDCLQYHINLVTWVPVEFQQKTNPIFSESTLP